MVKAVRSAAVALAAVAACWAAVGIGMANLRRNAAPERALAYWPLDARAKGNMAERLFRTAGTNAAGLAEAESWARSALDRDPTVVDAWRVLGIAAAQRGDRERGAALVRTAERLSRRDVEAQLWLVEESLNSGDLDEMLRHVDQAMRVSPGSWGRLTPLLIFASVDRGFATRLANLLKLGPPWARDFSYQLTQSQLTGANVPLLVAPLANRPDERAIMIPLVERLAKAGDFVNAWRVYRLLKPSAPAAPPPVNDGGFSENTMIAPFDWTASQSGPVAGERQVRPGANDDVAMVMSAEAGTGGVAASQLLLLEGGRYTLTFEAGTIAGIGGGRIAWRIACAGGPGTVLTEGRLLPAQPSGSRQMVDFTVPGGCPAQALAFALRAIDQIAPAESWIDNVAITKQ